MPQEAKPDEQAQVPAQEDELQDGTDGLAFLGKSAYAFGPILFAQGAMLAGVIASRVLYNGESLLTFKLQIGGSSRSSSSSFSLRS